jgi:SAM-dependent methyltransferase
MSQLYPEFFQRLDESPDAGFYAQPRLLTHIGEAASRAAGVLYDRLLPDGHVLDLMASYYSHLPPRFERVTGLGLNEVEMERNPTITGAVVRDINREPSLPFASSSFDAAVCTVSVQYLTRPLEVFAEVARLLKPGAPFVVAFSNRMFPTKAVLAWRTSDDAAHVRLVRHYFTATDGYGKVCSENCSPEAGDPLYACWAYRRQD